MSFGYNTYQNNLMRSDPYFCSCHCTCHSSKFPNNNYSEKTFSISHFNNYESNDNYYNTFTHNICSLLKDTPKNISISNYKSTINTSSKRRNYFLTPKSYNSNKKVNNAYLHSTINYYSIINKKNKCNINLLQKSDFDLSNYNLGRKNYKSGKNIFCCSQNKNLKFNRNNISKTKKLLFFNDNNKLKELLSKVPKHEKSNTPRSLSWSIYKNKKNIKNQCFIMGDRINRRNSYDNLSINYIGKYISFIKPVNDLETFTKKIAKIQV